MQGSKGCKRKDIGAIIHSVSTYFLPPIRQCHRPLTPQILQRRRRNSTLQLLRAGGVAAARRPCLHDSGPVLVHCALPVLRLLEPDLGRLSACQRVKIVLPPVRRGLATAMAVDVVAAAATDPGAGGARRRLPPAKDLGDCPGRRQAGGVVTVVDLRAAAHRGLVWVLGEGARGGGGGSKWVS